MKAVRMPAVSGFEYVTVFFLCLLGLTSANVRDEPSPERIIYPKQQQTFYYLDTIEVTYKSDFSSPWLHTWCKVNGVPQEKTRNQVNGFNSSALVQLTFKDGGDPCWFQLSSGDEGATDGLKILPFKFVELERIRTAAFTDQASLASNTLSNNALSVLSRTNISLTTADRGMEEPATKSNDTSVPDMLGTHVGIGAGAAVAGIALGSLISILCLRFRRGGSVIQANLESTEIGGRDSPGGTVFSANKSPAHRAPEREVEATKPSHAYKTHETSPICTDESASCSHSEAAHQQAKTYATDFAMADRQIWTDHLQSRLPKETPVSPQGIRCVSRISQVDSGITIYESMDMNRLSPYWH
ncbi:hypothetical protein F4818DRAFT_426385 [Hypoxylon cercidicola]|nr:hypothetical protein F4818DRAFT_426385 [Hypoxylon cercidicola]